MTFPRIPIWLKGSGWGERKGHRKRRRKPGYWGKGNEAKGGQGGRCGVLLLGDWRPGITAFHTVTHMGMGLVFTGSATPPPQGAGSQPSQFGGSVFIPTALTQTD